MNIFERAKLITDNKSQCPCCKGYFVPDKRNLNRGWGIFCSKSCSVSFRNRLSKLPKSDKIREIRDKKLIQLGIS